MEVRTGRPVNEQPPGLFTQHTDRFVFDDDDMDSNTVTESDMLLKSRSFLHRVNDRVRKMLDQSSKDATQDSNKHSSMWWMFMFSWERNTQKFYAPSKITEDLTMKQMFDISEKLIVGQSDEIYGVTPFNWEDSSGEHLSLIGDEESHQSLAREGLRIFRFCVMPWKGESEPTIKFCLGRQVKVVQEFTTIQNFGRNWWWANGIRVDFFRRIHHIAALQQSPRVTVKNERKSKNNFTGRIIFLSMLNDISWRSQDNEQECESNANFVSIYARRISSGRW